MSRADGRVGALVHWHWQSLIHHQQVRQVGGGRDKGDAHGPMSGTVRSRAGGRWQQPRMSPDGQGCLPMTKGQGWPRPGATKSQGWQPRLSPSVTPGREVEISLSLSLLRSQSCRPNRAGALVHWCTHPPLVHCRMALQSGSAEWQSGRVAGWHRRVHPPASACRVAEWHCRVHQSPPECIHLHPPASTCIHLHPPAEWQSGTAESTIIRRDARHNCGSFSDPQLDVTSRKDGLVQPLAHNCAHSRHRSAPPTRASSRPHGAGWLCISHPATSWHCLCSVWAGRCFWQAP